jgi:hypothetical protein
MMATGEMTKVKLTVSGFQLEYEGREAFLQSEIPNLVLIVDKLVASRLATPVMVLQGAITESLSAQQKASALLEKLKDSLSELGQEQQLRMQMIMDRMAKADETMSNALKKISDTADAITQNLK